MSYPKLPADIDIQLAKFQKETMFPADLLPEGFSDLVKECFRYTSPYVLRMSLDDFKALLSITDNRYNVLDMNTIGHVVRSRNANELGLSITEYLEMQERFEVISRKVLEMVNDEQRRLSLPQSKLMQIPTAQA